MHSDVVDLRTFYAAPLGGVARRLLGRAIRARWDNVAGLAVLGVGYAVPYLDAFLGEAERVLAAMPAAQGVVVSQVFPSEKDHVTTFAREARSLAEKNKVALTPGMMEGFASAKVAVAALRNAGPNPTRASVLKALNSMERFDMGGLTIAFSPADHTGLDITDLSIISKDSTFLR